MNLDYDAIIIGGGPAGSSCAINLLNMCPFLDIFIADKKIFPRDKACGDGISPGAIKYLSEMEINIEDIPKSNMIKEAELYGGNTSFVASLPKSEDNVYDYGLVVRRTDFDDFLLDAAYSKGTKISTVMRFVSYKEYADRVVAKFIHKATDDEIELSAQIIIGADGAVSRVRKSAGIPYNKPHQTGIAIRAYADLDYPHHNRLIMNYSENLRPGYSWIFPLGDGTANIGLGMLLSDWRKQKTNLNALLEEHFDSLKDKGIGISNITEAKVYNLPGGYMPKLVKNRMALIGDAGSMINPLSGEGIMYALKASHILADNIADALLHRKLDISHLEKYEKTFKKNIVPHFRSCSIARKSLSLKSVADIILDGADKDIDIRSTGVNLMFGEGVLNFTTINKLIKHYYMKKKFQTIK